MSEIERTSFRLVGAEGAPIRGWIHAAVNAAPASRPVVVFIHGFKGFQDWGPWPAICDGLAEAGFDAVRFDLSHNGVGDDGVDFSALHLFARNTISKELFDIGVVLEALPVVRAPRPLFLFGHSRGAADAIVAGGWLVYNLFPSVLRERFTLAGVMAWAPIRTYFRHWDDSFLDAWAAGENAEIENARTKQMMPLGPDMQRDLKENFAQLSVFQGARALAREAVPLLVVHGAEDPAVHIWEGRQVRDAYQLEAPIHSLRRPGSCTWAPIRNANHTFGAVHPFAGWTPELQSAYQSTLDFIQSDSCSIMLQ